MGTGNARETFSSHSRRQYEQRPFGGARVPHKRFAQNPTV